MGLLKIYTFPDAILRQRATPVTVFDEELSRLSEDMLETMYDAPGVGLAANQVGIAKRLLVLDVDYNIKSTELDEDLRLYVDKNPRVLINPEILKCEGRFVFNEGCLSVPGYTDDVERAEYVEVKFQDVNGKSQTIEARDLLAVAIQHEIDHLEGKLFIDRLSPIKRGMAKSKIKKERDRGFERSKFHVEL